MCPADMDAGYDIWSSHVPALALAVQSYGCRVLEIGAGWYSTPLLHLLSPHVLTLETDPTWAKRFAAVAHDQILLVPDLISAVREQLSRTWDVVFLDSEHGADRVACADLFLDQPCCIVGHDTEWAYWSPILAKVKYTRHFDFMMPRTSFMSNVLDVR